MSPDSRISPDAAPRVVVVHSSDEMYGADKMLHRVLRALDGEVDPLVLLPDDVNPTGDALSDQLRSEGFSVSVGALPILRRAYLNPSGLVRLARRAIGLYLRLRAERPAVVWCATSAALIAAPIARLAGVPHVVLHNQEIWGRRERAILGTLGRWTTSIIAISPASDESLPKHLRLRTVVIDNATETARAHLPPRTADSATFLVASRWNAWKGHATLLNAWRAAGEPGQLLVAGGPPPLGEAIDVRRLVSTLGLEHSVSIVGERADLADLIEQSHFVVVPSDDPEPFGLIAIEAFAAARPVVASEQGGLGQIVTSGQDGFLFANRDASALARVLGECTVERSMTMSPRAFDTYRRRFSLDAFSECIGTFWSDMLNSGRVGFPLPGKGGAARV